MLLFEKRERQRKAEALHRFGHAFFDEERRAAVVAIDRVVLGHIVRDDTVGFVRECRRRIEVPDARNCEHARQFFQRRFEQRIKPLIARLGQVAVQIEADHARIERVDFGENLRELRVIERVAVFYEIVLSHADEHDAVVGRVRVGIPPSEKIVSDQLRALQPAFPAHAEHRREHEQADDHPEGLAKRLHSQLPMRRYGAQ